MRPMFFGISATTLAGALIMSSCSTIETEGTLSVSSAPAPLSGVADGTDHADHDCRVVLREVRRNPAPTGYETDCSTGACYFVWGVLVDISDEVAAEGGEVGVMYQSGSDPTWWEAEASGPVEGAAEGFQRYSVRIFEHTVGPGMSLTSLMRTRIQMIPVAHMPTGGRLFDHNRLPGDFDNYLLVADNEWAIADDPGVCSNQPQPLSTLRFLSGWSQEQHGAVVAGGLLDISYEYPRLPDCRASNTFAPAWDIEAQGRFLPGGQEFAGSVVAFSTDEYGRRHDDPHPGTLRVEVPEEATSVEIWFWNWSAMSSPCQAWDSQFGDNYRYEVVAAPPSPVVWAGDWGNGLWRDCSHRLGLDDPIRLDSYLMERACLDVYADVYIPGVTDGWSLRPELVQAQVELSIDGGEPTTSWLSFVGRVGNNYRYRWTMPREELRRVEWNELGYAFRFSTDGIDWYRIAASAGPEGGPARTVVRDFSMPGWDE